MFKLEHSSMAVLTLQSKSNESNWLEHHRKRNVRRTCATSDARHLKTTSKNLTNPLMCEWLRQMSPQAEWRFSTHTHTHTVAGNGTQTPRYYKAQKKHLFTKTAPQTPEFSDCWGMLCWCLWLGNLQGWEEHRPVLTFTILPPTYLVWVHASFNATLWWQFSVG